MRPSHLTDCEQDGILQYGPVALGRTRGSIRPSPRRFVTAQVRAGADTIALTEAERRIFCANVRIVEPESSRCACVQHTECNMDAHVVRKSPHTAHKQGQECNRAARYTQKHTRANTQSHTHTTHIYTHAHTHTHTHTTGHPRRNRLKWVKARSCLLSKVGKERPTKIIRVLAKMPLHSGWDRMAVVLLTLKHLENLRTEDAINKYKQELGGDAMRRLPDRQQSACAKGQLHKALDSPGDRRATKRASARHTLHFPAHVRRRGIP